MRLRSLSLRAARLIRTKRFAKPSPVKHHALLFLLLLLPLASAAEAGAFSWQGPKTPGRVRFALCQTPSAGAGASNRLEQVFDWGRLAVGGGADVVVFPELAFSSFSELDVAWRSSTSVWSRTAALAREGETWIVANHPTATGGETNAVYNETRVFGPDGAVAAIYRKRVLAHMDVRVSFSPGPPAVLAEFPFARIGLLVCKDAFFPDKCAEDYAGADILLVQFAHPGLDDRSAPEARRHPPSARALRELRGVRFGWRRLGKPFLAVNKAGRDGPYNLVGGSLAADASGRIVAVADAAPAILFVDFPLGPDGRILPEPASPAVGCSRPPRETRRAPSPSGSARSSMRGPASSCQRRPSLLESEPSATKTRSSVLTDSKRSQEAPSP